MQHVYMDHAATTPVLPEVIQAMSPYFSEEFGNPAGVYSWAREAHKALDQARDQIASLLKSQSDEIVFTGGGSESNNLALKGLAWARRDKGNHIITTAIEHHAVLESVEWLSKNGFEVTILDVDEEGLVDPQNVAQALRPSTILVSVMHANNEVGTIQPISEIGMIVKEKSSAVFHTDAVQTVGVLDIDVNAMHIDLLSLSAHKFYGPKGVGALYVRKGIKIEPFIHGGGHERKRRAGTENIPGIVGMAKALELSTRDSISENERLLKLRDRLLNGILRIPNTRINGSLEHRLPNNVNVCFEYIEGESLLLNLDMQGIAASSGSACTSGSLDPSHVLLAMGLTHEIAHGSLRLTLGRSTTEQEVDYVLEKLPGIVQRLRDMSPLAR